MEAVLSGREEGLRILSRVGIRHKFPTVWVTEPLKARVFILHPPVARNRSPLNLAEASIKEEHTERTRGVPTEHKGGEDWPPGRLYWTQNAGPKMPGFSRGGCVASTSVTLCPAGPPLSVDQISLL